MARPGTINKTRAVDVSIHAVAPVSKVAPLDANAELRPAMDMKGISMVIFIAFFLIKVIKLWLIRAFSVRFTFKWLNFDPKIKIILTYLFNGSRL
jgi:hypothetical protein